MTKPHSAEMELAMALGIEHCSLSVGMLVAIAKTVIRLGYRLEEQNQTQTGTDDENISEDYFAAEAAKWARNQEDW